MAISLYDLGVPTFLQTLRAVGDCLDRATRHCDMTGADAEGFVTSRLHPDMAPFHFQIEALTHHAVWGMEAVRTHAFTPPPLVGEMPFADLRAMVGRAVTALEALDRDDVDGWPGGDFEIEIYRPADEVNPSTSRWVPRRLRFTPESFLLTYSLPNLHFHATIAYAILRVGGVPVGKRDYEGVLRVLT